MGPALEAALERLTVADVAAAAGRTLEFVAGGRGLCRSPFPENHTNGDRNPSFSIPPDSNGRGWVNHAGRGRFKQKGGVWDFARECRPEATDGDIASWLVEIAGTGDLGGASDRPKESFAERRKRQEAEHSKRLAKLKTEGLKAPPLADAPPIIPLFIRQRYEGKISDVLAAGKKLSKARGWPVDWGVELVETGQVEYALLPWAKTDKMRGWAFKCECPADISSGLGLPMVPVGYHQRFRMGKDEPPSWVYVPYAIDYAKAKTPFQKELLDHRYSMEAKPGQTLVPPMPFVIGELDMPKLVIITEGQWDAVTMYGALGGFDDGDPIPVCVFGLRGVGNPGALLSYWLPWLFRQKLRRNISSLWIMADLDGPGRKLLEDTAETGKVPRPSFRKVLEHNTGLRVVGSFPPDMGGKVKDFNDWYKLAGLTVSEMWQLVEDLKLI